MFMLYTVMIYIQGMTQWKGHDDRHSMNISEIYDIVNPRRALYVRRQPSLFCLYEYLHDGSYRFLEEKLLDCVTQNFPRVGSCNGPYSVSGNNTNNMKNMFI